MLIIFNLSNIVLNSYLHNWIPGQMPDRIMIAIRKITDSHICAYIDSCQNHVYIVNNCLNPPDDYVSKMTKAI